MKYRIVFEHGEYSLWTEACTSSEWDVRARSIFRWPLHLYARLLKTRYAWRSRNTGYREEFEA